MKRTGPASWLFAHLCRAARMLWPDPKPPPLEQRTPQANLPYHSAEEAALFHELDALLDPRSLVPEPRRPTP